MDTLTLLVVLFTSGLALAGAVVAVMAGDAAARAARRGRLNAYVGEPGEETVSEENREEHRRRRMERRVRELNERKRFKQSRIGRVHALTVQAGINVGITRFWGIVLTLAIAATSVYYVIGWQPLLMPYFFLLCLFVFPVQWLRRKAAARQRAFTKQFPDAIDIIVRGLESGMPLAESVRVISTEMADPISTEFRTVINEVNAGMALGDALERAHERLPSQELRFFATVVSIQATSGGNLAQVLGNISSVLRGRAQLKEKAKALSAEARFSAIIVAALPFLTGGFLWFANNEYISILATTTMGNVILGVAAAMMSLGVFVMNRMGKLDF